MARFLSPDPCLLTPETKRRGFTLLEVIVVIAIFGALAGLLLAGIGHARVAAARARCQNNLRQQGLAVLAYESSHGVLPPSAAFGPCPTLGRPTPPEGTQTRRACCSSVI